MQSMFKMHKPLVHSLLRGHTDSPRPNTENRDGVLQRAENLLMLFARLAGFTGTVQVIPSRNPHGGEEISVFIDEHRYLYEGGAVTARLTHIFEQLDCYWKPLVDSIRATIRERGHELGKSVELELPRHPVLRTLVRAHRRTPEELATSAMSTANQRELRNTSAKLVSLLKYLRSQNFVLSGDNSLWLADELQLIAKSSQRGYGNQAEIVINPWYAPTSTSLTNRRKRRPRRLDFIGGAAVR